MFPTTDPELELQAAILRILLIAQPRTLTRNELVDALTPPSGSPPPDRTFNEAVAALAEAGLVVRRETAIVPSRAALHYEALELD